MNTGPKYEAAISEMVSRAIREQYSDTTLPPDHLLSRHVRRVASRILAASNLGIVREGAAPFSDIESPDGGVGGDGWDPDAELNARAGTPGQGKEWDVIVVNDLKMINAQVVPGNKAFLIDLAAAHATL